MGKSFTLTIQILMLIIVTCLTFHSNATQVQITTIQCVYKDSKALYKKFKQFPIKQLITPVNNPTTIYNPPTQSKVKEIDPFPLNTTTKKTKSKSKLNKIKKFKNYVYIKGGVARTRYNKFKEGESSIYIAKRPNIALMYIAGLGHKFTKSIRGDIAIQYGELKYKRKDDMYDLRQKAKLFSVFANGYYDIPLGLPIKTRVVEYLTAGAGIGYNKSNDLNDSDMGEKWEGKNTTNFIWNIGAGIKFDLTKRFTGDVGYRFLHLGNIKVRNNDTSREDPPKTQKITAHQVMISLVYNF